MGWYNDVRDAYEEHCRNRPIIPDKKPSNRLTCEEATLSSLGISMDINDFTQDINEHKERKDG
jgi:hypothetical protein